MSYFNQLIAQNALGEGCQELSIHAHKQYFLLFPFMQSVWYEAMKTLHRNKCVLVIQTCRHDEFVSHRTAGAAQFEKYLPVKIRNLRKVSATLSDQHFPECLRKCFLESYLRKIIPQIAHNTSDDRYMLGTCILTSQTGFLLERDPQFEEKWQKTSIWTVAFTLKQTFVWLGDAFTDVRDFVCAPFTLSLQPIWNRT